MVRPPLMPCAYLWRRPCGLDASAAGAAPAPSTGDAALGETAGLTGLRKPYRFLLGKTATTLPPLLPPLLVLLLLVVLATPVAAAAEWCTGEGRAVSTDLGTVIGVGVGFTALTEVAPGCRERSLKAAMGAPWAVTLSKAPAGAAATVVARGALTAVGLSVLLG